MNRGYSRETYLSLIEEIRKKFSLCSITTDIIVGFPGETDQDFTDTLKLMKEAQFDAAYTFLYSSRSGTPAAKMPEQIPLNVKKERLQMLMEIQNEISLSINQKLIGQTVEILVEGESKTSDQIMSGRTRTNKIVNFPGDKNTVGKLIHVDIKNAKTWHLEGKMINSPQ